MQGPRGCNAGASRKENAMPVRSGGTVDSLDSVLDDLALG
jgi:hypothetical protein